MTPRSATMLAGFLLAAPSPPASDPPGPRADEVMRMVVERAQRAPEGHEPGVYRYRRQTTTEEFDSKGRQKARQEKVEDMVFTGGEFFRKHIHRTGKTLLEEKLGPDAGDGLTVGPMSAGDIDLAEYTPYKRGEYLTFLTADVIARYDFKVDRRLMIDGRATLQISFKPKSKRLPARQLIDRILNEMFGTLWIDEEEFEMARGHFMLQSEVYFFGGIAGVLRTGDIRVKRVRVDEGVWLNHVTTGDLSGRKLLESQRLKLLSVSDRFQKLAEAEAGTSPRKER